MLARPEGSSKAALLGSHHSLSCPLFGPRPGTERGFERPARLAYTSERLQRFGGRSCGSFQRPRSKAAPAETTGAAERKWSNSVFDNIDRSSTASISDVAAFPGFNTWRQTPDVQHTPDTSANLQIRSRGHVRSEQSAPAAQNSSDHTQQSINSRSSPEGEGPSRSEGAEQSQPYEDDWGYWGWPAASPTVASKPSGPDADIRPASDAQASQGEGLPPVMEPSEVESALELPDLTELTAEEVERVLPITPSPEQIKRASGSPYDLYNRLGTAAIVSLLTIKVVLVATLAVLYPLLGPLLQALNRNRELRSKGRHVALWRASVVEYAVEVDPAWAGRLRPPTAWGQPEVLRLLIGDRSGARSQLSVPFEPQHRNIQVGDAAELLVLAPQRTFKRFQALREVYFPQAGIWLADYPHISRDRFLDLSLMIEQERQSQLNSFDYSVT